jgi:anti-sigma factor ChrR (cupin superfamily)
VVYGASAWNVKSGETSSVVRFEPGTGFAMHTHTNGEEVLVLSGVFEDKNGRYPAGTYFRNPAGSRHAPVCPEGCEIFVKLDQFQPHDSETIRLDTVTAGWLPGLVEGLSVMPLHSFGGEHTPLVKWSPGTVFTPHTHPDGEEIFVIEGVFQDENGHYPRDSWLRNPPGSVHRPCSEEGCVILVKVGHITGP